jgi:PKD repeat protein/lysophospholipase L1-like esterase
VVYLSNPTPPTNFAWSSATSYPNTYIGAQILGKSPVITLHGDSLTAGHPNHYSYIENSSVVGNVSNQIGYHLSALLGGIPYQNLGIGGETCYQIRSRFGNEINTLSPNVAVIMCGNNDYGAGETNSSVYLSNMSAMWDMAIANGVTPITIEMPPATSGTTAQMRVRDNWTAMLESLAITPTYTGKVYLVNESTYVGQFRAGGDTGNLWDIIPAYNSGDNIHFNELGYTAIAQATSDKINLVNSFTASFTPSGPISLQYPNGQAFVDTSTGGPDTWNWTYQTNGVGSLTSFNLTQNATFFPPAVGNYTIALNASTSTAFNISPQVTWVNVTSTADPNPYSMISYKAGSSNVQIDNTTLYVGTVVNRNITSNTTVVLGNFTWDTRWFSVSNLRVNTSIAAPSGITLASSFIGNGFATFNVSKPSGMTLPANALIDFDISYVNYTTQGSLGNFSFDATSKYYDPINATYWNYNTINGADAIVGAWVIRPDFSANRTLVNTGNSILFSDTGQGEPNGFTNYYWSFGDGGLSTSRNPVYSYAANGNYSVSLTTELVANTSIRNSTTKTNYITVTSAVLTPPVANFTGLPTVINPGGTVAFTDTSTNAPTSWLWNFGDGSGSTLQNPTHAFNILEGYPLERNFTVSLTATNAFGSNTTTKVAYINSQINIAGFNQQDLTMAPEFTLTVNFVDSTTNLPIPVVLVMDSLGRNQTTSVGTFVGTYPYSTVVLYLSSSGYDSKSASYIVDSDRSETVQMVKTSIIIPSSNLNLLYPHEVQFTLADSYGHSLSNVNVTATMTSSSVENTNWYSTLFGISTQATSVNATTLYAFSDDSGSFAMPMISSGRYTMNFTSVARGISESRTLTPQQANYIFVLTPTASLILNRGDYINGTLYQTVPNSSYVDLNVDYIDIGHTTTGMMFFVNNGATGNRLYTKIVAGYNGNSSYSAANIASASYVWGYYANSSQFGNVSEAQGIMMKGVSGKMFNLDPCGGYATGWGNEC